jgi:hypothetical protein
MRRGIDGLGGKMQTVLHQQPFSGRVFPFRGRRADKSAIRSNGLAKWDAPNGHSWTSQPLETNELALIEMKSAVSMEASAVARSLVFLQVAGSLRRV